MISFLRLHQGCRIGNGRRPGLCEAGGQCCAPHLGAFRGAHLPLGTPWFGTKKPAATELNGTDLLLHRSRGALLSWQLLACVSP